MLLQELVGGKYNKITMRNVRRLMGYELITMDEYGTTAVYVKDDVVSCTPIRIQSTGTPKEAIQAAAVIIPTTGVIRNRRQLVFVSFYLSPNSRDAVKSMDSVEGILDQIRSATADRAPNVIIGGDVNIWSEQIGSDLFNRAVSGYNWKYEAGDRLHSVMWDQKMCCITNREPTMWKSDTDGSRREFAVDTLWVTDALPQHADIQSRFDRSVQITDQ